MSLSSDLTHYFAALEESKGLPYLYRPDILQLLQTSPDFQSFKAALEKLKGEERLLVLLRSLATQKTELSPRLNETELVVTFPGFELISARHTRQVVRQVLTSAAKEVLVAGFAITEAGGLLPQLVETARRGVRVLLLCSGWKDKNGKTAAALAAAQWPPDAPRPSIFEHISDPKDGSSAMHIKCILADSADLLIGSANFTFPGLNKNFEMGVRIKGPTAQSARALFDELLRTGRFREI